MLSRGTSSRGVVLVTGSAWLEERVRACAAAAGTSVEVLRAPPDPGVALPAAALEVWGADALEHTAGPPPTSTPRVVVTADAAPDAVWRAALEVGARGVVQLPTGEAELVDVLLAAADDRGADGTVVGVTGACGGAGASVLAVALARAGTGSARGGVLLADLDDLGGGADVLVGLEDAAGLRWADLAGVRGALRPDVLEGTLPRRWGVDVLAPATGTEVAPAAGGGRVPPPASEAVVDAARRSHGLVVLDLPRGLRGVEHLLALVGPLVLVVPGQVRAGVAAGRLLAHVDRCAPGTDVRVVVRAPAGRGGGPRPVEVARALGRPLDGVVPHDAHVAAAELRGRPFPGRDGALVRWARGALGDLARADPAGVGVPTSVPTSAPSGAVGDLPGRRGWRPRAGPSRPPGAPAPGPGPGARAVTTGAGTGR
ncbi:septum site-determining protein Ssd [Pseudokineococcus basanitobsidens]|uniref:Septum site-determining protein Ssd n=1 Tax=Pseudokineococcus basanitobsidens TaxID=1926649 RepID=A0ABU8RJZ0_9ACTN